MWPRRPVGAQLLDPPRVERLGLPGRLGEEPLQALRRRGLRPEVRLGPRQPGQRLVALARQEQPVQIVAEGATLGQAREAVVELPDVGLQRDRCGRTGYSAGHGGTSLPYRRTSHASPNKLPIR